MSAISRAAQALWALFPGIAVGIAIALAATALQWAQARLLGEAYIEALVVAILLGALVRSWWTPGAALRAGIAFTAKPVLEMAIVLLGASISFAMIARSGPTLLAMIIVIVAITLCVGYAIGRMLGLPPRLATLIACGNAVCGNSAIAAVAPAIGATGDEVASSISFTAILGVIVVLGLPLLAPVLRLSEPQYGVLAGLTVYAVPQVLAAAAPGGPAAMQIGTLVKLIRVLTLGPIVLGAAILFRAPGAHASRPPLRKLLPWFITGFLLLAALRSLGLTPPPLVAFFAKLSGAMTVAAMAALGLGVDLHALARVGARASAAVTLSLIALIALSLAAIRLAGIV